MSKLRRVNGNLRRAERKIRQFSDTKQWCGCLTPSEALALLDDGGKEHQSVMYQRAYLTEKKNKGDCRPSWFYFFPSKKQMERWT